MTFFTSAFLGIIEGITEFLPISSTGHLILSSRLLSIPTSEFLKTFEIAIQLGAILAVVVLYAKRVWLSRALAQKIIVAFLPTAVIGFLLYPFAKSYLLGSTTVVLWSLLLGGVVIIVFEYWYGKKTPALQITGDELEQISYQRAIAIGLFQSLAIIPGVSRAGATILGGLALGISRKAIVEFSFLLAIPTILGATVLDIFNTSSLLTGQEWFLLGIGGVLSFISAILTIRFLLRYIQNHTFTAFGVYRIALAIIILLLF